MSNETGQRTKRTRRHSRKHPGVVLIKPDPARRTGWRARYQDPDSGKVAKETLDSALTTAELREDWAKRKSKAITERKRAITLGAPRATRKPLTEVLDEYFEVHDEKRLRPKTLRDYRAAANKLISWASTAKIRTADDLTKAKLRSFRDYLVNEPKQASKAGGKRGERVARDDTQRSPRSVNRELASLRAVFGWLYETDRLAHVRGDDLKVAFKKLPNTVERIEFLQGPELRQLFRAALAHDSVRFTETRVEHLAGKSKGSTPRFESVAPVVAVLLLSGMRLGEALTLEWSQVALDALDNDGLPVGEIRLTGATKTKRARTIDLAVSPALRTILAAMKEQSGNESHVLGGFTEDGAKAALERLRGDFGAPAKFTWQALRRTCGTFLTNAPGIFGAASAYRSARQLGHSVAVAEKHYLGLVRGIPATAKTLEAAMNIEAELNEIADATEKRIQKKIDRAETRE